MAQRRNAQCTGTGRLGALRTLVTALTIGLGLCWLQTTALAAQCASQTVGARGEPASQRWLALVKARGNWRSKVRAMPTLGADFASWDKAANPVERCVSNTGSIVCTVTAVPCKP